MSARIRLLISLAWRNLWRNPRRTVITLLVVSVGIWSTLSLSVVLDALAVGSRNTTLKLMTGEGQIHARGYGSDPTAAHAMSPPTGRLGRVLAGSDLQSYATRVRVSAIIQSERRTLPVTLVGVMPDAERAISVIPSQLAAGRYLTGPTDTGIVLGRNLVRRLKTKLGKRVVLMTQRADGGLAERAFPIVGEYTAPLRAEDEFVFTGLSTAQSTTGMGHRISEIAFFATSDKALSRAVTHLRLAAPGLDVQSWKTLAPLPFAVSAYVDLILAIWIGIAVSVVTLGIVNTQLMAVFERTREFGLVQALGMKPRWVLYEVALETMWLNTIGVMVGIGAAVIFVHAFPHGLDLGVLARGAEIFGGDRTLHLRVEFAEFARYSFIVWGLGVTATLWPAWRASKVNPIEAMGRV